MDLPTKGGLSLFAHNCLTRVCPSSSIRQMALPALLFQRGGIPAVFRLVGYSRIGFHGLTIKDEGIILGRWSRVVNISCHPTSVLGLKFCTLSQCQFQETSAQPLEMVSFNLASFRSGHWWPFSLPQPIPV